jgi:hypothetical protein
MSGKHEDRCTRCRDWLFGDIEIDTGLCGHCADYYVERSQRQAEWDYYHPGEPAPRCEIEPGASE